VLVSQYPVIIAAAAATVLALIGLLVWLGQSIAAGRRPAQASAPDHGFLYITETKLILLYCCTLGLYGIFWFYQNWKQFPPNARKPSASIMRALLSPVFCNTWFAWVHRSARVRGLAVRWRPWMLTSLYIAASLAALAPGIWFLLMEISVVPLAMAQAAANRTVSLEIPGSKPDGSFSVLAVYSIVAGILLIIVMLATMQGS
jgi:hypothetical protein